MTLYCMVLSNNKKKAQDPLKEDKGILELFEELEKKLEAKKKEID